MSGHFRNVFVNSPDIFVLLVAFLLCMLRLDNFFMILSYNGCFSLRTLLKDKKKKLQNFGSIDLYRGSVMGI